MKKRVAVVLFNLGGPDRIEAVQPFLQNLFNDPAILTVPSLVRKPLAWFIAKRRGPVAREVYEKIGGRSPIVPETLAQAQALEAQLVDRMEAKCFVAMRYWNPRSCDVLETVKDYEPDLVLLVPLYPQFSTTTSASSIKEWELEARKSGFNVETRALCCYPTASKFIKAHAGQVERVLSSFEKGSDVRVLFSAHGLPKKIVDAGDPYQWQVEQTAAAIVSELEVPGLDWQVCYQSRVGPLEWIGPSIETAIEQAGQDGCSLIVVPIAFVSEHSETLVELDMDYADLAKEVGVPTYVRVGALGCADHFIESLADLVIQMCGSEGKVQSSAGRRICPNESNNCLYGRG